ncbi:hypothetical protein Q4E93_21580 [Flavitalea sp. BT771]|nr:hypothetical protein [Flavitalea sp. BT771]MDO6433216.1 hypothetical protein [Flavitalea sp. BT771]MDV6221508.1 hypothetical protein [Flavitalea sp. BT771]
MNTLSEAANDPAYLQRKDLAYPVNPSTLDERRDLPVSAGLLGVAP